MDAESARFVFDTVVLGVGTAMGQAVEKKELTIEDAQAGMDQVFYNLGEMLLPNWRDAFMAHINAMNDESEKGRNEPVEG